MTMTWQYEPAADLDQTMVERLRRFPREPDMMVYAARSCAALLLRLWLRLYHRLRVSGLEHLPAEDSFILVANHASHLDALSLVACLPLRKLHRAFPAAAQDYFFASIPRTAMAAVFVNALPFSREVHARQSLKLCRELLQNPGNILILFPEGTRSTTGAMGEFKPGIGMLLAGMAVPVIPCRICGAYDAWPKGRTLPRPRSVQLILGPARTYAHLSAGKQNALFIAHDLKHAVEDLAL